MNHTNEWHERRRKGIGGSDVAAILGLSKWKSPLDVWLEKTGQKEAEDISEKPTVKAGIKLESVVCDWYSELTGNELVESNDLVVHPVHEFLIGNLDRRIKADGCPLEAKTGDKFTAGNWGTIGSDDVPSYYYTQGLHYAAITDSAYFDIAVLLGGNDFRWYHCPVTQEDKQALVDRLVEWWQTHVIDGNAPEPVNESDIKALYSGGGEAKDATMQIMNHVEALKELKEEIKDLDGKKKHLEIEIQKYMGNAESLCIAGETAITWKPCKTTRLDTKRLKTALPDVYEQFTNTTEYRRFIVK